MNTFKIGADPEIFVADAHSVRSIVGKVGGSKAMPLPLTMLGDGFAVQEDNVALEFNIPACTSKSEFVSAMVKATGFLERMMYQNHQLHFNKKSAMEFPDEELQTPESQTFGCEPDFNAWTLKKNPRPRTTNKNLRSCGGHIHIGNTEVDPILLAKACDLFLGVPSTLMDDGELRRSLYGKAGAFRKKEYGIEYRVLSNYWIFQGRRVAWAYDNTKRALDAALERVPGEPFGPLSANLAADKEAILAAIDNNDKDAAQWLVHKYGLEVLDA